jgi:tripartite-type tricarboxylate transporter receptor subunit TctC
MNYIGKRPYRQVVAISLATSDGAAKLLGYLTWDWLVAQGALRAGSAGFATLHRFVARRTKMMFGILRATAAAIVLAMAVVAAPAQTVADFYKGKNVELYIGYSVGGGYDLWARVLARHIGQHIPGNPTIVVKNMEGAGSLRLANWLYRVGPKDGSVFGIIGRGTGFDPLLGQHAAQFDATKFTWIGSGSHEVSVCVSFEGRAGITTFDDLRTKEMTVGGTGASADTDQFPKVVNGVLGTKMKIVSGYPGGNDVVLAMERGELQGRCGWSWSSVKATHGSWIAEKKLNILVQLSLQKHPDLPDVPLITDLAKTDEDRQILKLIFARQVMGRPFLAPPGIPAERADALRKAFSDTMMDPAFMADAEKSQLEVNPVAGDDLQKLVAEIYRTPSEVAKKAAQLLAAK